MVHWSQFAGSLWDNVLAAHVHAKNLVNQAFTFNAAVDDFILNTFTDVGERWSAFAHRHCQYVRLCFDNLTLMACRTIVPSLQLEGRTSDLLQVAVTAMAHVRVQGWVTTNAYLLRHQMITTLAASLHLLCRTLVCDRLEGQNFHQLISLRRAEFHAAVDLLSALAQSVPLAQRVLDDFEQILPVVRHVFVRYEEIASSTLGSPDWTMLGDVVPPDAAKLLPYKEQIPDIRFPMLNNGMWATNGGFVETDRGFSSWDAGLEPGGARSSVLWV